MTTETGRRGARYVAGFGRAIPIPDSLTDAEAEAIILIHPPSASDRGERIRHALESVASMPPWVREAIDKHCAGHRETGILAAGAMLALIPALRIAAEVGGDSGRVLVESCLDQLIPKAPLWCAEFGDTLDG